MKLQRRKFILGVLAATAPFSFLNQFLKKEDVSGATPNLNDKHKSDTFYQLKKDEVYVVKGHDKISPPLNPKEGDCFYLVIDKDSLENPAILSSEEYRIEGYDDFLELDSLANIKITFFGSDTGWAIS
jgi:hypothetical protein